MTSNAVSDDISLVEATERTAVQLAATPHDLSAMGLAHVGPTLLTTVTTYTRNKYCTKHTIDKSHLEHLKQQQGPSSDSRITTALTIA